MSENATALMKPKISLEKVNLVGFTDDILQTTLKTNSQDISNRHICDVKEIRTVSPAELVACIVAGLTVIENVIILIAISRGHRSLRKPPYWFIASLAVADLLTGAEVMLAVFLPIGASPISRIFLKGSAVVTFIASVNSLLLVAFDRYFRIVRFAEYKTIMRRSTIILLIVLTWVLSFAVFLVAPLLGWSCADEHCCAVDGMCVCTGGWNESGSCGRRCSQSFVPFTKSYILLGLVYFSVSVITMTVLYMAIFKTVKEKSFGGIDCKSKQKREVKLAKTLAITLGIFVVCWLPVQALFITDAVATSENKQLSKMFDFALVPSVINSFMNPIIYSIRLPRMRATIEQMLFPCCSGSRATGSAWRSSTSGEPATIRKSIRKLTASITTPNTTRTPNAMTRGRIFSNRTMNSEMSSSHSNTLGQDM